MARSVLVVDDDSSFRQLVVGLLRSWGHDVAGEAGSVAEAVDAMTALRPDTVLIDVEMPPHREDDGLIAAMELRRRQPALGILVLSQFNEESYALDLIGDSPEGVGYLLKERVGDIDTFISAIKRVAAGGTALDAAV